MDRLIRFSNVLYSKKGLLTTVLLFLVFGLAGYALAPVVTSSEPDRFMAQLYGSRILVLLLIVVMVPAGILQLNRFFQIAGSATQLALFRILFFGFFFIGGIFYIPQLWQMSSDFASLPASALVDLPLMNWYPKLVPFNTSFITIACILFAISIVAGLLGYRPRIFIPLFVLTGFYLFGIPNFYGKVNHNHHILWFAAVLAFSPCTHAFSIDAYLARRNGKLMSAPLIRYSQPLRLIWLLIGIIYFFPGFWKLWSCGLDWALTDNVRNHFFVKWSELGDWQPFFRINQYPIVYKSMGMFTLMFELFFVFLLFNKSTRKMAIIAGLLFHLGTLLFMKIFFIVLLVGYAAFIPLRGAKTISNSVPESRFLSSWTMRIGIFLIIVNSLFGIGRIHSWPFSVYPTFDTLVPTETKKLLIMVSYDNQTFEEVNKQFLMDMYRSERYRSMENQIIQDLGTAKANDLMLHLSEKIREQYSDGELKEINFWLSTTSYDRAVPIKSERIYTYSLP